MPVSIGPLMGFAIGALLAWLGRREAPRDDRSLTATRHGVAALFGILVFAPACGYFMVAAGDWALFYLTDSRTFPSAVLLLVGMADAAAVVGGFAAGYRAARAQAERAVVALAVAPFGLALAVLAAFHRAVATDGTFHQVSAGFGTRAVLGGPLGFAVVWAWVAIGLGTVLAARALDHGRAGRAS